ncbi:MAG: hypothetical protein CSA84_03775 [Actinomycetales bacterium]|nr:MAG: hypothetical protein CSA84_03775 [Actinomycetales bacterium]
MDTMREHETREIDPHREPLGKVERRHLRHRWHRRVLVISRAITAIVVLIVVVLAAMLVGTNVLQDYLSLDEYRELADEVILLLQVPLLILVLRAVNSAKHYATGALANEQQFEHVHAIVEHYSRLAGLKRTPSVAIVTDGRFIAKSISNYGKAAILVNSDLVDAPRPNSNDWGALRFAIAREIGHIAAGHRDLVYELTTAVTQSTPYLSTPLRRAEAYTADRYGAVLAPDAVSDYFAVDAVSKDCWQDMSIRSAVSGVGKNKIGQVIVGLVGEVPPTSWRLQALAQLGVFRCEPEPSHAASPAEYRDFLRNLPIKPTRIADLRRLHGAFLLPPKPMTERDLDELCPKGTIGERLSQAFAAYSES